MTQNFDCQMNCFYCLYSFLNIRSTLTCCIQLVCTAWYPKINIQMFINWLNHTHYITLILRPNKEKQFGMLLMTLCDNRNTFQIKCYIILFKSYYCWCNKTIKHTLWSQHLWNYASRSDPIGDLTWPLASVRSGHLIGQSHRFIIFFGVFALNTGSTLVKYIIQ